MNCNHCGTTLAEGASVCPTCGTAVEQERLGNPAEIQAPEKVGMGILGALIGALIGGASIVLISQMGYVAAISGLLMAFCTLKGYELLGKKLSKKGIVICIVVMILTTVLADWVDWAILLTKSWADYGITFGESLTLIPVLLADGTIEMSTYLSNLGMLLGFMVLGAFGTIRNALRRK